MEAVNSIDAEKPVRDAVKNTSFFNYQAFFEQIAQITPSAWIGIGSLAFAAAVYLLLDQRRKKKQDAIGRRIPVDRQSITITYEGQDGVRASPLMLDGKPIQYMDKNAKTLHELFLRGLRVSNNGSCLGWRPTPTSDYEWITYQEVLDRSQRLASGLISLGARACTEQFVGIFSQNRVEWKVTEQACNSFSMVVVPLYDTLGPESIAHIVNQCELKIIVVDKSSKAQVLLNGVAAGDYTLDVIVCVEDPTEQVQKLAEEHKVQVKTFAQVDKLGADNLKDFVPPSPDDLHTILYTSGTTGLPKGAMLTHGNLVANAAGAFAVGKGEFLTIEPTDVHISYLPLAHGFERAVAAQVYYSGARVGFFQGDVKLLLSDVGVLKPTIFPMVPRLINKIYDKIMSGASQSRIKKFLLDTATKSKLAKLHKGIVTKDTFWDTLVFRKIQNLLGGRARLCITGAAPVSTDVLNFMRVALGVYFTEGYGQTEATAAVTVTIPGDYKSGSVGTPVVCNVIKLVDVPEQEYYAKNNKGEVCVKGTNVFKGYYKDEAKTKEALDEDGWLHTGDVGMWMENGSLKIIDRKKHIFKLAQGEYIAPEKIEQILVQSAPIAQVFVYGYSLKANLVAVVVPDVEVLQSWSGHSTIRNFEELCHDEKVQAKILADIQTVGRSKGLKGFEIPKRIHVSSELFSVENNLLTPTFKSRRPQIYKRYQEVIDKLYEGLE